MIALQSMDKREYYLRIAERVFPELKTGRFFAKVNGIEHYFSGLIDAEVKINYKSFYDEYDFAFSIRCTFSLCDKKTETRWVRQEGSVHYFNTPLLFVVERDELNFLPDQIVQRMRSYYRANTLLLGSYAYPHRPIKQFKELMKVNELHFILHSELENVNASGQSGIVDRPSFKQSEVTCV